MKNKNTGIRDAVGAGEAPARPKTWAQWVESWLARFDENGRFVWPSAEQAAERLTRTLKLGEDDTDSHVPDTPEETAVEREDEPVWPTAQEVLARMGVKYDQGKPPMFRGVLKYFPRSIEMVSRISEWGAKKYAWNGWITVDDGFNRYSEALLRHLIAPDEVDEESGYPHAAHAAWNALARLELYLMDKEKKNE